MRNQDKDNDLDLPSFGPAEREPEINMPGPRPEAPKAKPATAGSTPGGSGGNDKTAEASGGSGNGLSYLIILLLAAAVGGLAFWSYMQHEQLMTLEQQRLENDRKVLELQQLLQVAEDSAAQSGESLLGQVKGLQAEVGKLGKAATDKHKQLDSEIGKLWAVAHQRNTPKIAELEKQMKAEQGKASKQAKSVKDMVAKVASLEKQLKAAVATAKTREEQIAAIKQSTTTLSTEFQILQESVEIQQAEHKKKLSGFAEQIVNLQSNQNSSVTLERRVKVNEQAVKAIDGSRILLNKELLQIRQKLNNLQLQVESL